MNTSNHADLQTLAQRRVDLKMGFLRHLCVFLAVNSGLALWSWLSFGSAHLPYPMWGWAIGLVAHGFGTLMALSGQDWRQRMVNAELARLQSH